MRKAHSPVLSLGPEVDVAAGLARLTELAARERYLGVLVTTNADASPQVSVLNAGLIASPLRVDDGATRVGAVAMSAAKIRNLRLRPRATLVVRAGWEWIAVRGAVTLIGPDDPHPEVDDERLRILLRDIFSAAGGAHDDLDEYDRVMRAERRVAVLITPERFTTN